MWGEKEAISLLTKKKNNSPLNHLNKTVELLFELLRKKKKKKEYSENPNLSLDLNSDRENKNEGRKDLAVHFFVLIGKLHDDLTLHSHL